MIEPEGIWEEYGLEKLQEGIRQLFPETGISLQELLGSLLEGNVTGAVSLLFQGLFGEVFRSVAGMKNTLVWLVILGIGAALLTHFIEVFDRHQIADMGFYYMYLMTATVLFRAFTEVMGTASETLENIVLFIRLMVPSYLLAVGLSSGIATVSASHQLLLLLIYGAQTILAGVVLPLIYSFCVLSVINGVWSEEKLSLLIGLMEKAVGWILKAALGIVTGLGIFQAVVTPAIDSLKTSAVRKALSAIPGVGNAADGVVELVVGSAAVIKNSIGVALLLLLLVLCAAPLLQIFAMGILLKAAAAFMGIVSSRRITACVDRTGEACFLLFRTVGTALLLFLIILSLVAVSTNRGF